VLAHRIWHRVTVFAPAIIARIEAMVQKGTRVRLLGRIRPSSYDDDQGRTRYVIEFVLGPFSELEVLVGSLRLQFRSIVAVLVRPRSL
uniref:single-stranded DNA-binding protein n=1 Tax=Aquidulcibacter paucihalophilus TaxID=1978549 RepID=UPI0012FF82C7